MRKWGAAARGGVPRLWSAAALPPLLDRAERGSAAYESGGRATALQTVGGLLRIISSNFIRWLEANESRIAALLKKLDDAFYAYWGALPFEIPGE